MESKYFECKCHSSDHTIRFVIDDEDDEIYVEVQLNRTKNVFQRIWAALKYICGHECRYGHWDCTLLKDEDREELIKILEKR